VVWAEFDPQFIGEVAFWVFGRILACSRCPELITSVFGLLWFAVELWGKESKGVGGGVGFTQGPPWSPYSLTTRGVVDEEEEGRRWSWSM